MWSYEREIEFLVSRHCNRAADAIASRAKIMGTNETWVGQYPSWLCSKVIDDLSAFAQRGVNNIFFFFKKKNCTY